MGVRYRDWSEPAPGTRVRYHREDRARNGQTGEVVKMVPVGYLDNSNRKMALVKFDKDGMKTCCYVSNLERINEVSRELVGPKPKPLEEPEHPTPWSYTGNLLLDANGKKITRLAKGDPYNSLSLVKAELLAKVIVEAINEKYKVEDAPTPW